jgi:hypothetical protein
MARANPHWSRRRITAELANLGHGVDKNTDGQVHASSATAPSSSAIPDPRVHLHHDNVPEKVEHRNELQVVHADVEAHVCD